MIFLKCDLIVHMHQASLNLDYKFKPARNTHIQNRIWYAN